jgi:hypothetical protein
LLKCSMTELKQRSDLCGYVKKHKKQKTLSKWNQRFCVLCGGILLYFDSDKDGCKNKGYIVVGAYKFTIPQNSNGFTFELEACDKSTGYTFQADHKKEVESWKKQLSSVADQGYTKETLAAIKDMNVSTGPGDEDEVSVSSQDSIAPHPQPSPPAALAPTPTANVIHQEEFYEVIPAMSTNSESNITQEVSTPPPVRAAPEFTTNNLFVGLRDCIGAPNSQDLSFRCGDVMYILDRVDVNWWIAHHVNGTTGLVPKNYLKEAYECMA